MKLPTRSLLTLAAVIFCAGPLFAADSIELKQQWQAGKKYSQTMDMVQTSTTAIGPQKMEQKMTMKMEMSTAVRKHEDGKQKRLTVKYDRMAMDMDMNGQHMAFDSAKPDADQIGMGKQLSVMVGKELRMLANEKDEVTTIENFEEFVGALGGGAAAGMPLGQMFTKESLSEMVKQGALRSLPGKPVKVGESWPWDYQMQMPAIGSVAIKGTYTFKGVSNHAGVPCAEIGMDGKMDFDFSGGAAPAGGAEASGPAAMLKAMGMKMTAGKMVGTVWFDNALGMAREAKITQEMEMTMNNPTAPDQKLVIPTKQAITVTLTKIEDVK
jgi:hypothetical protein